MHVWLRIEEYSDQCAVCGEQIRTILASVFNMPVSVLNKANLINA